MNDPRPVILFDGDCNFCNAIAFRRLACVLAIAGLLCVFSAQGQVIREEGFPVKGGVPEESAWAPVVREECDPFTVPGEFGESCAPREKTPDPFGFGPEAEARPGEPSAPVWRTPPRLECPAAIFLEELETGQVECHAWDASGEEYLEYSWEPAGSTTRDYLDNPRLIPEDAPNPSVVAPEAPAYETLESFYSGETTFLYRYRLTATSRATGLSSWREVEVYVSGSRPSVYCPLEVAVEEGEAIALDCEGVDPLSHRMDYDEDGASILWEWEGLWGASTSLLDATDRSSALFTAPAGSAGEEYHYIASMTSQASGTPRTARRRVTVRVVGGEAVGDADSSAGVTCDDSPYSVYEGAEDLLLDCDGNGPFNVNVWLRWSRLGEQVAPPQDASSTPKLRHRGYDAIFDAPDSMDADEIYEYTIAIWTSPGGPDPYSLFASDDVRITVLNKPAIDVDCAGDPYEVDEGNADFDLDCTVSGAPGDDPQYTWSWSPTDNLTGRNTATPTFDAPDDVDRNTTWTYTVTASAENADDGAAEVRVTVLDTDTAPPPSITCNDSEVYEGADDITLDCSVANEPTGATYAWAVRGSTSNTNDLSSTTILQPTFAPPGDIDEVDGANKDYEYTVTMTAGGVEQASEDVMVTVLEKPDIYCSAPRRVVVVFTLHESTREFPLRFCPYGVWTGAPGAGAVYAYAWTALSSLGTANTDLLSAANIEVPTFYVPDEVESDLVIGTYSYYSYMLTVSAENADDASVQTQIKVPLSLTCADSEVYEGADDITLDCSVTNAPSDAAYSWTGTDVADRLSGTDGITPTFSPPGDIDEVDGANKDYEYTVTMTAGGVEQASEDVMVTVLEKPDIYCPSVLGMLSHFLTTLGLVEGSRDYPLRACASGWEGGPVGYTYAWTARNGTPDTALLSAADIEVPTFDVPDAVDEDERYSYTLTVSAANADDAVAWVDLIVWDIDITVMCESSYEVYEGSADIELECEASGAPRGSSYTWSWSPNTRLTDHDTGTPTFAVPGSVEQDTTYTYAVTATAENADDETANVTVTVLDTDTPVPSLAVNCQVVGTPSNVSNARMTIVIWEKLPDPRFACEVTDAPENASYVWSWTASTGMTNLALLSADDIPNPFFDVPDIDGDERHEYIVTATSDVGETGKFFVDITVREWGDISVTCTGTAYDVPEGADTPDFAFDCRADGSLVPPYTYTWSWSPTDRLTDHDTGTPTFDVPEDVDRDTTYVYTATVTSLFSDAGRATVEVTVRDTDTSPPETPGITCIDPDPVYEGADDITLDCSVTDEPSGATYAWTGTDIANRLSSSTILKPTFDVPDNVDADTDYEYTVTLSASGIDDVTEDVTVKVLNKRALSVACAMPSPVYEGSEDFALDCSASGAPAGSEYTYVWTGRGSTPDTALLSAADIASPTFYVPEEVDADETYEYTLTVSADNAESATEDVTVKVLNKKTLDVACATPSPVYEGSEDFALDCAASGAPAGSAYAYEWTAQGGGDTSRLSSTTVEKPTFEVPEEVDSDETYEYTLTVSADNAESATEDVTVKVLNKKTLDVACATPSPVYEGSEDFALDCAASGAPGGSTYEYEWTASNGTANTARLSAADIASPTFAVPEEVDEDETYEYTLTVSAENAESATAEVTVKVLNLGSIALVCASPPLVYEGSADFALDCSISGDTGDNVDYTYEWTAIGSTTNTDLLSAADIASPTFYVPDALEETTTYEYLLTASAENAESASAEVTVTVLNRGALAVICADPGSVYEGSADIAFDCSASGAPAGSAYEYAWTAIGSTTNTDLLSGADIASPTFYVPDEVAEDETYEYTLTVSAENADPASADVTVTVLNRGALSVVCVDPPSVYEGSEDFALDCSASGVPAGSDYAYEWTARGSTANTARLSATEIASPTFYVPEQVDEDETYEYTLTVSAANADPASADVTVTVLNKKALYVACATPSPVHEGSADFALDCAASGAPGGSEYEYAWMARGSTTNTDLLVAGADGPTPTFDVPEEVDEDETYEYLLTVSAANADPASADVTVTVLNKKALYVACATPSPVHEGSADFALDCAASGAPGGSEYEYAWMARGSTTNTDLLVAGADGPTPTFDVPEEVDEDETYEYLLTVSAENAESATAEVTVKVLNLGSIALVCASPPLVYEGSADFALDCSISGDTGDNVDYAYAWTARGSTTNTSRLSAADIASPMFYVPEEVDATTTYEYLLTASAANAESATAEVTVTVLNRGALALACADPGSVYEGSADIAFDCSASGAPAGSAYEYAWTAIGSTTNTDLLSGADIASPTFYVPDEVAEDETYEYLLTVSAANAESASAEVTVTVLNRGALAVICADPGSVYEGSENFALDCSASGAPAGSAYEYAWTAIGATTNTDLLSGVDIASPTFYVPDALDETTTYEYLLTVLAENAEDASADVTVTVLNRGALAVICADPGSVYEGSENFALDCSASGAPAGSAYEYAWTAIGATTNTDLLSGVDIASPTFYVPDALDETTTYEYLLTVSAENAEDASADVTVTVLNVGALRVVCAMPSPVYEGSEDFAFDCSASGAPGDDPQYTYAWTARGDTPDTALLSNVDIASAVFAVPDEVDEDETYEYTLTVSADNAESVTEDVTVTVLNKEALALACADPGSVYEGSADIAFDCSASGAPGDNPQYTYAWTARGDTPDTSLLSAADVSSPMFYVPDEVDEDETYEYTLTVSADNAEFVTEDVTVTVLNKEALALACADPGSVYEGSADIAFDCSASGAPGDDPQYTYAWTARGDTPDTSLLSAGDTASPTFHVPEEVEEDETYEYLLTVSAANAKDAAADVTVTVLDRIRTPAPDPVSPPAEEPPADPLPAVAESSSRAPSDPSALGVTVSASSLRFGVQSAQTRASLDPMTDQISTRVSGPYHAGRMTLSPGGGASFDENGEMDLSIEVIAPVLLKREGAAGPSSLVLSPSWSFAESCEQLSSQAIGGLYTEATLTEGACRLLRFGGELDLTDAPSGRYAGAMDVVLRSGEREETHSVEVEVTVVPAQRVITIGPGGVRFSTSREVPAGLTEDQSLSIYPDVAFLTEGKPNGAFELSNPSLIPLEVSVSARFGYTEATENGREVVIESPDGSRLGDLSQVVDIHPGVLVLMPGEKGLVRYGVKEGALAAMAEQGYAAFFDVVSSPRQYVRSDRMPEEVTGERTARVTMRVPGVYVPGEGASQLRATLLSLSYGVSMSATFLLETQDRPFAGEVVAYDGQGRELGRRETLVYTRSRVRVPLARMPEEEVVFLRFAPWGSSRVPEPTSVEWNAPGRDIGAAGEKEGRTTPKSALQ